MKYPTGHAPPRRQAAPKKQVRLNLRRRPAPAPDDEVGSRRKTHFWKWVILVALLHVVVITAVYLIYENTSTPPKPPEFEFSLLPPGDVVKGTPGTQAAPKVGPTTSAPSEHHHHVQPPPTPAPPKPVTPVAPPKPPTPKAVVQPPPPVPAPPIPTPPQPVTPKPIVKADAPPLAPVKPVTPPKPTPPKPPKVKVDLKLVDGPPVPVTDKPVKPKPPTKKPPLAPPPDESNAPESSAASNPDSHGLSKEQIAEKLGDKLQAAGVKDALKIGTSGSDHSQANPFADFYASLRDQVMSRWTRPNLSDETAINPVVQIHVEKDGRVPPESVILVRSSGNHSYDESALAAARGLGNLLQPLPDGCPPDISINFKLTR